MSVFGKQNSGDSLQHGDVEGFRHLVTRIIKIKLISTKKRVRKCLLSQV